MVKDSNLSKTESIAVLEIPEIIYKNICLDTFRNRICLSDKEWFVELSS